MQVFYEHNYISNDSLVSSIRKDVSLQRYFTSDFGGIKTSSFCGSLKVGNSDILILPKISKSRDVNFKIFTYMILYSHDIKNRDIDSSTYHENLLEVFIDIFSKSLLEIINRNGLYKEYVSVQNENSFLKGKLILKDYILKRNVSSKILCEYDEFSANHKLNQFFTYTVRELKKFSKNKLSLIKLEKIFSEVEPIYNEKIEFNHLNIRFKENFNLAKFLLKHLTNKKIRNSENFSFMFDMDLLFEDFIGKIFKEVANAKLQEVGYFGNLKLTPDIVLDDLIVDLKYKIFKDEVKKEDKYQMYIYGNNFERKNTMLLYPKHFKNVETKLKLGNNEHGLNLFVRTIDLDSDSNYKEYISEIKKRIERILYDERLK
ncbi:McrBC 5-methylcytosine restriction system component [Thiovulum sp. ES]|nr:McrBC 5-methylcytosine restriction system component [Thiovulum sp. ES]